MPCYPGQVVWSLWSLEIKLQKEKGNTFPIRLLKVLSEIKCSTESDRYYWILFTSIIIINGICIIYIITYNICNLCSYNMHNCTSTYPHTRYIFVTQRNKYSRIKDLFRKQKQLNNFKSNKRNTRQWWEMLGKSMFTSFVPGEFKQCSTKFFFRDEPTHLCAAAP